MGGGKGVSTIVGKRNVILGRPQSRSNIPPVRNNMMKYVLHCFR